MQDIILKGILYGGDARFIAISSRDLVQKAKNIHNTSPVCSAALGRTLTACSAMAADLKSTGNRLSVIVKGDGPAGSIVTAGKHGGRVKGYINNPAVDIPLARKGKLAVGNAVGKNGTLTVIKDLGMKEPYIGTVSLQTGELGDDFAYYFATSEQQPSLVYLGVIVDTDLNIKAAGGIFIFPMPGMDEESLKQLEERSAEIQKLAAMLALGQSLDQALEEIFEGIDIRFLEAMSPEFNCDCSRERLERVLISFGRKELEDIISNEGSTKLTCHFCNEAYDFSKDQLEELILRV